MSKVYGFFLALLMVSMSAQAYEPVLDHQGMLYFNLTFDAGQSKKIDHDFGFRFDRSIVQPRESISLDQLNAKPAVFNLKLNNKGLKAFNVHGIDYSYDVNDKYVYHGAEGGDTKSNGEAESQPIPEAAEEPRRKIAIPLGVIIGALIGTLAVVQ
ncbi:MAG: hypothetical protein DHS20C09_11260 [marine bacterium B5-7]|nr:MAG: hypothetical protein DHS20C09_11260 [marine bacterium B5-7]